MQGPNLTKPTSPPNAFHVLANPRAGTMRNGKISEADLAACLGDEPPLTLTRDLDHLEATAHSLREQGVETVALLGGDGTISRVLTTFARVYGDEPLPAFFLLGGGTVNALMDELELESDPLARLEGWVDQMARGIEPTVVERTPLAVQGTLGFAFGVGYLPRISAYHDSHDIRSSWTGLWVILKVVLGLILRLHQFVAFLEPVRSDILLDDHRHDSETFNLVFLSSISRNGLDLKICPSGSARPDRFEAVVGEVTVGDYLRAYRRMIGGEVMSAPRVDRRLVERVHFAPEAPMAWFMDGERYPPEPSLTVALGPRLRFLL